VGERLCASREFRVGCVGCVCTCTCTHARTHARTRRLTRLGRRGKSGAVTPWLALAYFGGRGRRGKPLEQDSWGNNAARCALLRRRPRAQ
jgi:hypothetical protein